MIFLSLSMQISWVCVPNRNSAQPFITWEKTTDTTGFAMYSDANRTNTKKIGKTREFRNILLTDLSKYMIDYIIHLTSRC